MQKLVQGIHHFQASIFRPRRELFILRNAGNIVPQYGAANGGEGATIEFAVAGLGVILR